MICGVLVGLFYAALNKLWVALIVDSDPLRREVESPGARSLYALGWGALASIVGGVLFSVLLWATGSLSQIAGLVGMSSPIIGFGVNLSLSIIIGASFGLLFQNEVTNFRFL